VSFSSLYDWKIKEIVQEELIFFSASLPLFRTKSSKVSDSYTVVRHSASTEIRASYIPKCPCDASHYLFLSIFVRSFLGFFLFCFWLVFFFFFELNLYKLYKVHQTHLGCDSL